MAIPGPLVIKSTIKQSAKDFIVGTDPTTILSADMAIVINSANFTEKTQTCVGVLTKCRDQILSTLKEHRGDTFYNVSLKLADGGNKTYTNANTVAVEYGAVIVGSLFGQNTDYGIGGGANLAQLSHDIDKQFKQLINVLLEQDVSVVA